MGHKGVTGQCFLGRNIWFNGASQENLSKDTDNCL